MLQISVLLGERTVAALALVAQHTAQYVEPRIAGLLSYVDDDREWDTAVLVLGLCKAKEGALW